MIRNSSGIKINFGVDNELAHKSFSTKDVSLSSDGFFSNRLVALIKAEEMFGQQSAKLFFLCT